MPGAAAHAAYRLLDVIPLRLALPGTSALVLFGQLWRKVDDSLHPRLLEGEITEHTRIKQAPQTQKGWTRPASDFCALA
jgi:hypothetical protein